MSYPRLTSLDYRLSTLFFPMPNIVNVGYRSTNYYAIDIQGGRLLVDCGWPGMMAQFTAAMKRMGVFPSEIKYILATHYHPDHAGLVQEFKRLGAKLLMMENQLGALQPSASHASEPLNKHGKPTGNSLPAYIHVSPDNVIRLRCAESRDFLVTLGLHGEIVATPGHSDDSVTLVLDDGSVFTGDLPPRFLVPDDNAALRASWAELDRHGVKRVYPAHGGSAPG